MQYLRQWLDDVRWALVMIQARRWRRRALFGQREEFDNALRPYLGEYLENRIAYPSALYHVTAYDFERAALIGGVVETDPGSS